jgi:hypothetical protein
MKAAICGALLGATRNWSGNGWPASSSCCPDLNPISQTLDMVVARGVLLEPSDVFE